MIALEVIAVVGCGRVGFGRQPSEQRLRWPARVKSTPLHLRVHHDEGVQVYLNGVLALDDLAWTVGYLHATPSAAGGATLVPGTNSLAVHCRNTVQGQFIDVGIGVLQW